MYSTLLFDLDGTLTDPWEGITRSVQYALAAFGIDEAQENLTRFIGPPLQTSFMEFYGFTQQQAWQAVDKYRERFADTGVFENKVYPGVPEMLAALVAAGKRLAVASSKPEVYVRRITDRFGLTPYFEEIVGSELDGGRAEKAAVIEEALARLGLAQNRTGVLMVGDRKHDVLGAAAAALPCAGVAFGYAEPGELAAAGAIYIAPTVAALHQYLLQA